MCIQILSPFLFISILYVNYIIYCDSNHYDDFLIYPEKKKHSFHIVVVLRWVLDTCAREETFTPYPVFMEHKFEIYSRINYSCTAVDRESLFHQF